MVPSLPKLPHSIELELERHALSLAAKSETAARFPHQLTERNAAHRKGARKLTRPRSCSR
jgi:hypothetical protein